MASENTNSVYIKWTIDKDAFLQAFPGSTSVEIGSTSGFAFINYDGQAPTETTHSASVPIVFNVQPRTSKPRPSPEERFADHTKVVCQPDVAKVEIPSDASLITIKDVPNPHGTGRIYKKFDYETKHIQSIIFQPKVGSEILSDCKINDYDFKTLSINVLAKPNRVTTFVRLYKKTGEMGDIVLRRIVNEDGSETYSRRCFNILVNPEDAKKNPDDLVDILFISIESITVDPETGLWTELKLAMDEARVPLSAYRFGGRRRRNNRFPNSRFGGQRRRRAGGRFPPRQRRFRPSQQRQTQNTSQ